VRLPRRYLTDQYVDRVLEPVDRLQERPVRIWRRTALRKCLDLVPEQIDRGGERLMRVGDPRVVNVLVERVPVPGSGLIVLRERGGELVQDRSVGGWIVDERLQGFGERLSIGQNALQLGAENGLVRRWEQTQVLHEPARVVGERPLVGKRGLRLGG